MNPGVQDHRVSVALSAEQSLEAVERAAELWGAQWNRLGTGGRLEIPVHAGVRHGIVTGRLWTEPERDGTSVVVRVESSHYSLKKGAVSILAVGALGALALTLWPLYPPLLAVAPLALVFAFVAWLVIASRLQSAGVEDFLKMVASAGDEDRPGEPSRPPD
ncbi:MAG: hypothetical protein GY769_00350 [bacterium]|nr:hypothetical protein [bacterium]